MSRTLYLSDVENALLRGHGRPGARTVTYLNRFVAGKGRFGVVSARGFAGVDRQLGELALALPILLYDGALMVRPGTGERLDACCMDKELLAVEDLRDFPGVVWVHALIDGRERISWVLGRETGDTLTEVAERQEDPRLRPVGEYDRIWEGRPFRVTLTGTRQDVAAACPLLERGGYLHGQLRDNPKRPETCRLEVFRFDATREYGARKLKLWAGAEELVCFGGVTTDLSLFRAADRRYAVPDAPEALREAAHGVLSMGEDAVAEGMETMRGA